MSKKKNTNTKKNTAVIDAENMPSVNILDGEVETIIEEEKEPVTAENEPETIDEKPVELSAEEQAVKDFCEYWNGLKNHHIITDKEARQIHSYWQIVFKRTDYYVNCGVCSANRIKALKKKAKNYGYKYSE